MYIYISNLDKMKSTGQSIYYELYAFWKLAINHNDIMDNRS